MMIGNADWWSRILAIVYAWTLGIVIGIVFVSLAMVYVLIGTGLRLIGVGRESDIPLWSPIKTTAKWWINLHSYAIGGSGSPISLIPPVLDPQTY